MSWSPVKEGLIASASEDTTVCHWYVSFLSFISCGDLLLMRFGSLSLRDITNYEKGNPSLDPINTYRGHTSIVEVRQRSRFFSPSLNPSFLYPRPDR